MNTQFLAQKHVDGGMEAMDSPKERIVLQGSTITLKDSRAGLLASKPAFDRNFLCLGPIPPLSSSGETGRDSTPLRKERCLLITRVLEVQEPIHRKLSDVIL